MIFYLIGMMGSGKSSVGKLLAKKLQFSIIDIDNRYIVIASDMIDECMKRWGTKGDEVSKISGKLIKA